MRDCIKAYCEAHPDKVSTRCTIKNGNYPCISDGPAEWGYSCGKNDLPRCPYLEYFSSALEGQWVKYEKDGEIFVGYVKAQCPERIVVTKTKDERIFNGIDIDINDIIEIVER